MAEEELQESEVLFSEHYSNHYGAAAVNNDGYKSNKKMVGIPLPVSIAHHHGGEAVEFEEYDEGETVPPHVVLARRIAGEMAFSVCTGHGRTLKGRDLSQVRNSVLRMTGFLEA
ncbi:hypothetical protein V6N13_092960 [Hibiscus sabdariffa]|uniref:Senescence-associated protein n=1 Tax=Hibiscus sabdariffa TaxID=183260 RepID=A0ABR2NQP6_9ROSI